MWGRSMWTAQTSRSPGSVNADAAYYKTFFSEPANEPPHAASCGSLLQLQACERTELFKLRGQLRSLTNKQAHSRREGNLQFRDWQNFKKQAYSAFDYRDRWSNPLGVLRGTC